MGWFSKKKDDWYEIWTDAAHWFRDNSDHKDHCFYTIKFSPSRKKFELECEGHKPTQHPYYGHAKRVLVQFNLDFLKENPEILNDAEKSNEIHVYGHPISKLSIDQCKAFLDRCISEDDFETAELLKGRIDELEK